LTLSLEDIAGHRFEGELSLAPTEETERSVPNPVDYLAVQLGSEFEHGPSFCIRSLVHQDAFS
jgi:hypothetical protein